MNDYVHQMALEKGAKIILFIDKLSSHLTKGADVVFLSDPKSMSFYNSLIPLIFLSEVIITEYTRNKKDMDQVKKRFDYITKYIDVNQLY